MNVTMERIAKKEGKHEATNKILQEKQKKEMFEREDRIDKKWDDEIEEEDRLYEDLMK